MIAFSFKVENYAQIKMDKLTAIYSNHVDHLRKEAPSGLTFVGSSATIFLNK